MTVVHQWYQDSTFSTSHIRLKLKNQIEAHIHSMQINLPWCLIKDFDFHYKFRIGINWEKEEKFSSMDIGRLFICPVPSNSILNIQSIKYQESYLSLQL